MIDIESKLARLRDDLINETLLGVALVSLPIMALAILRAQMVGLRPIVGLQIVLLSILWLVWWQRRRISYSWRFGMIVSVLGAAGLAAYPQYGPASVAGQLVLLLTVICVLFTELKVAVGIGLTILCGLLLIAWGGISGALLFDINYQRYAHNPFTWAAIIVAFLGYGGTTARLVWRLLHNLIEDERELRQVNAELAKRSEEARAATNAKSSFLATMSHEIRTPMNGILGMAQMLMMPDLEEAQQIEYARIIHNSGQTLLVLLNDILDLSKVESGKFELESTGFDPAQLVHETQALFKEAAARKGLKIEATWGGTGHYLGDPHRLRQMLSNLVGNAIKFTERGEIRIEAREVGREGPAALLEFSVSDTGIGIAEDKQALLFQAFSQADTSTTRQYGGTGLGLSIVRSLAKLMGGETGVKSQAGQGSCFWFRIRADIVARAVGSREEDTPRASGATPGMVAATFSSRVMVAEDNPVNRMVASALLKTLGLTVSSVEDGKQAVDAILAGDPADVVLMDVHMPVMDGYEATKRIRQWEKDNGRPRMLIIALTADAYEDAQRHCLLADMDDFLSKPVAINRLREVLSKRLTMAR